MCATNLCECNPDPLQRQIFKQELMSPSQNVAPSKPFTGHPSHIPKGLFQSTKIDSQTSSAHQYMNTLHVYFRKTTSHPRLKTILATSQPAHALAIIAMGIVYACLANEQTSTPKPYASFTSFAYIASFALHVGSQYWMTFISGLSLYFTLERHAFGDVQVVLFPRYFTSNSILSAIGLISYSKLHSHVQWETAHWIQVIVMSVSFLLESLSRLYIAPRVVELISKKKAIEVTQPGVGKEIGKHEPGALKNCPHYMNLHNTFRKYHMCMAIVNLTTIACTIVQLCHISQSLCFVPS